MKNSIVLDYDALANHPASKIFAMNEAFISSTQLEFNVSAFEQSPNQCYASADVCSLLVDYATRKVGYGLIGPCFACENEMTLHNCCSVTQLSLQVTIDTHNTSDASYLCQVYTVENNTPKLIAESTGTLLRTDCSN